MKIIKFLSILLSFSILSTSCQQIAKEDRFIELDEITTNGKRTVLLEDFTGVNCVNCPQAAESIHAITQLYKPNIIPVGLHGHSGFTPKNSPLFCEEAEVYYNTFGKGAPLPAGMINRTAQEGTNSKINTNYSSWAGIIGDIIKNNAQLFVIEVNASSPDNVETVEARYKVTATSTASPSNIKIQLWVIENDIEGIPQAGVENNSNYKHQHVLRGALNGTWGENIQLNQALHCKKVISKIDMIENCKVVAFVYDAKTMEVYEAKEVKIN